MVPEVPIGLVSPDNVQVHAETPLPMLKEASVLFNGVLPTVIVDQPLFDCVPLISSSKVLLLPSLVYKPARAAPL